MRHTRLRDFERIEIRAHFHHGGTAVDALAQHRLRFRLLDEEARES